MHNKSFYLQLKQAMVNVFMLDNTNTLPLITVVLNSLHFIMIKVSLFEFLFN